MDFYLYLRPFFSGLLFTTFFLALFLVLPASFQALFQRAERRNRKYVPLRLGGVAMILGFIGALLLDPHLSFTFPIVGLLVGSIAILGFGVLDDMRELDWKIQLFFQMSLGVLVFLFGVRILSLTHPLGGAWFFPSNGFHLLPFLLLVVWLILVINSLNWLDGLDGLAASVAFITLLTIFFLALKPEVSQPPLALIAAAGGGVVLGFLIFNAPPARLVAGTAGSVFLGFLVAILAVLAGTKIATALLVLALPVADAIYVVVKRMRDGVSLFHPDHRHLHYRLASLGLREKPIVLLLSLTTLLIALVALFTQGLAKFGALLFIFALIFSLFIFLDRRLTRRKIP